MTRILVVGAVLLCAWRAEASCANVYACWCGHGPAELTETLSVADGGAMVRGEDGGVRTLSALAGEVPGTRTLNLDGLRELVGGDETIAICGGIEPRVSVAVAKDAASRDGADCASVLGNAGVAQPPCKDTRCSTAPGPVLLLMLGALWRRRRSLM